MLQWLHYNQTELLTSEADGESQSEQQDEAGSEQQLQPVSQQSAPPAWLQIIL